MPEPVGSWSSEPEEAPVYVSQVTDPVAYHSEGPVWSRRGRHRWVDMLAGDMLEEAVGQPVREFSE